MARQHAGQYEQQIGQTIQVLEHLGSHTLDARQGPDTIPTIGTLPLSLARELNVERSRPAIMTP